MNMVDCLRLITSYYHHGLSLVPLKPRSKIPLVKWKEYQLANDDLLRFLAQDTNWAIRCDENFHALDFDNPETYERFIQGEGGILKNAPTIRTGRGYHVWFKPKKPVKSFSRDGVEVKGLGSLLVVPPSIHPSGIAYQFEKPLNGNLVEVDIEELLGFASPSEVRTKETGKENAPSDFALRYGKSPCPQALCGKATKVLTRSDGRIKHMVSLRCWKWHCPKCAPLLKRYWLGKLGSLSFRFIIRLPTVAKPIVFLRHLGKPDYAHIIANGESWLFLVDGEAQRVWEEAKKAGYELIVGDISGDASPDEVKQYLERALCAEDEPLNTRRKVTHSRAALRRQCPSNGCNESKRKDNAEEDDEDMSAVSGKEHHTWNSEVVMKPIEEVAAGLELEGWHVLWTSEVEAIAVRGKALEGRDTDIVELMESLGIKLKKARQEYVGLCPFHDDHNPSLSVNREKGLWHCFGCERGGNSQEFVKEWQALRH